MGTFNLRNLREIPESLNVMKYILIDCSAEVITVDWFRIERSGRTITYQDCTLSFGEATIQSCLYFLVKTRNNVDA